MVPMMLLSVNVGLPREIEWQGKLVRTSIFKSPVSSQVRVASLNLDDDQQSDLSVHGGVHKAVYAYPSEHYAFWREEIPGLNLPWAAFGENLTMEGLLEEVAHIGDRLRIWVGGICGHAAANALLQARDPPQSPGNYEAILAQWSNWLLSCRPPRGTGRSW
jgi:MOSC domain